MKKAYLSSELSGAPLSGAYEANGLIFVSGQIHMNSEKKLEWESIEEKFVVVITNVKNILTEAWLTLEDVIRAHLYLTDLSELPALNQVYLKYFSHPLPARTAIWVSALPLGASIEMDVIAVRR